MEEKDKKAAPLALGSKVLFSGTAEKATEVELTDDAGNVIKDEAGNPKLGVKREQVSETHFGFVTGEDGEGNNSIVCFAKAKGWYTVDSVDPALLTASK